MAQVSPLPQLLKPDLQRPCSPRQKPAHPGTPHLCCHTGESLGRAAKTQCSQNRYKLWKRAVGSIYTTILGSQRVRHDWATELKWSELNWCKVDSQWKFTVWLRDLKQGLCDNLEGRNGAGGGREVQEGGDICKPMADSCGRMAETKAIL